jgi:hypothetical protein
VIVARIVEEPGGRSVRHLLDGDQVATTQLDRVDAEVGRGDVDEPFTHVVGFGSTRPAIHTHRRRVRGHRGHFDVECGHEVGPGNHQHARAHRRTGACDGIRAGVGRHPNVQSGERAVASKAERRLLMMTATMGHGHQALTARLLPTNRATKVSRERGHRDVLGCRLELRTEPATDLRDDDAHLLGRELQELGNLASHPMHKLRGRPQRDSAVRFTGHCERAIGFHRRRRDALCDELAARDHVGAREHIERRDGRADGEPAREIRVRWHGCVYAWCVRAQRVVGVHHERPRVEVDDHLLGGIDGGAERLGHDDGDDLADMADDLVREQRALHAGAHAGQGASHRQAELAGARDGDHAGHRLCIADVDRTNERTGLSGPHEDGMERRVREPRVLRRRAVSKIADVARGAAQQRRVFLTHDPIPWRSAHGALLAAARRVWQQRGRDHDRRPPPPVASRTGPRQVERVR